MFDQLVTLHRGELERFAARQLGTQASLAEEVVQEAFLNAHRAIVAGARPEHPRAWLFTIVRNAAINAARATRSAETMEEHRHGEAEQSVPAAVEQSEWLDWLMDAVGELPERQRDALVGHAFEGRSYREIAARQGTTVSAVKSLIGRARRALSADSTFPAAGLGTPFEAVARALRRLTARGSLAGKAGGTKGLAGILAQAVVAATVTTGLLMAVHGGGLGAASAGQARLPGAAEHRARAAAATWHHGTEPTRVREQRIHREGRRAIHECIQGGLRRRYGRAALRFAVHHLSTDDLEYTECRGRLRFDELHSPAHPRTRRGACSALTKPTLPRSALGRRLQIDDAVFEFSVDDAKDGGDERAGASRSTREPR
jgi:RNA polymerase sigma-70 factor (ECF subfamily)